MTYQNNILKINNKEIKFQSNIEKILEFQNCFVIQIMSDNFPDNNVFAIGFNGEVIWNIANIINLSYPESYIYVGKQGQQLILRSYSGVEFVVDMKNSVIISQKILK